MVLSTEIKQFFIMLYKGMLLRKRHYVITGFEMLLPIVIAIFSVVLCYETAPYTAQNYDGNHVHNQTLYPPFSPYESRNDSSDGIVILYAPASEVGKDFVQKATNLWTEKLQIKSIVTIEGYTTEELLEEQADILNKNSSKHVIGTVFSNINSKSLTLPSSLDYTIRIGNPYTGNKFHTDSRFNPEISAYKNEVYRKSYFLSWQAAVEQTFISLKAKDPESMSYSILMQRFPYPKYREEGILDGFFGGVQYLTFTSFLVFVLIFAKRLVDEKVNHSRELLRMMGLTDCVYWTSSFFNVYVIALIASVFITILYKIPMSKYSTVSESVLNKSDGSLFFVFLLLYTANAIVLVMAITRFVNKAVLAMVLTSLTYSVPYSVLFSTLFASEGTYMRLSTASKLAICLYPNGALILMFKLIAAFESRGDGIGWNTLTTYIFTENVNVAQVLAAMLVSFVMYWVIIWYVDAVWPWQDGVPKPLHFPFTKSYWCGYSAVQVEDADMSKEGNDSFEPDPEGTTPGIIVRHLKKNFRVGFHTKTVVDDVSLNIYSGQITALLGQNGAGKTTTINILTGLYVPDGGSATINGYDIRTQTMRARQSLGICPQENILYDTLTVREHLQFFAGIKGTPFGKLKEVANETLSTVGLASHADTIAKNLSGGMKRKLSLAIAIVGGSKVLFLDEPTSGLDPESRRVVWDVLLGIRQDRTVVLTTHFMEEADVLGDRIAILARGRLRCCGSPMFLKRHFGAGYSLRIVKDTYCKPDDITSLLKSHVEECTLEGNSETELIYSFPSETSGSVFGNMFLQLENDSPNLGISSYGMTVTTMDDVFLKVASLADDSLTAVNSSEKGRHDELDDRSFLINDMQKISSWTLLANQLLSLFVKRFHYAKRFHSILFAQLLMPFLMIFLMMYLAKSVSSQLKSGVPSLRLDPHSVYSDIKAFYAVNGSSNFMNTYVSTLQENADTVTMEDDPQAYILDVGQNNLYTYLRSLMFGGSDNEKSAGSLELFAWYNAQPYHALPMSLNLMHTALLRYFSGDDQVSIRLTNAPFSRSDRSADLGPGGTNSILILGLGSLFFPIALAFLACVYVYVPVVERVTRAKLLQVLTGLGVAKYWLGMFLWDMLSHFVVCIILLIPFAMFSGDAVFFAPDAGGSVFLLLILFGWCCIPLCYVFSHVFKKSSTGYSVLLDGHFITGLIPTPVVASLFSNYSGSTMLSIVWVLRMLLPNFTASWGLSKALKISYRNTFCDQIPADVLDESCKNASSAFKIASCCKNICEPLNICFKKMNPLAFDNEAVGIDALILFLLGCIYIAILFVLESGVVGRLFDSAYLHLCLKKHVVASAPDFQEDPDVIAEAQRIQVSGSPAAMQEALVVVGLTKNYGTLCAVDNLTFAVHNEECFGLLGINGAGKTSTFKMLVGDIRPTRGNAYIGEWDLQTNLRKFQSFLGYCPQYDPLIDRLSGREMLNLFAALRALAPSSASKVVNELIKNVGLEEHADKETQLYSGGNKRKLSLALAIIGSPAVILLDEPTSGVDPVSRRKIWNILEKVREISGSSVILCSHSMEECEHLCERLAIMVNGTFRCLGSIQQLKSTFGQGYMVTIKPKREAEQNNETVDEIISKFQSVFPQSVLRDRNQGNLQLHITDTSVPWSKLFITMEDLKNTFDLEDYLISGTTLEQIFLSFARSQRISKEHI